MMRKTTPQKAVPVDLDSRSKLMQMMTAHFDAAELRELCSELDKDYDDLGAQGQSVGGIL